MNEYNPHNPWAYIWQQSLVREFSSIGGFLIFLFRLLYDGDYFYRDLDLLRTLGEEPKHVGVETGRIVVVECPVSDCLEGCIAFINEANGAELRSNIPCNLCNGAGSVDAEIAQAYEARRRPRRREGT